MAWNMDGYATGMANDPVDEEEEENAEGNCKQPASNPVGGSHGWSKENAERARLKRAGNLAGYAIEMANEPE